jgi:WD40 repeat protein/GTPase SAR1 family protein
MVNAGDLFTVTSVGEPAIVLHRFGGTYGNAKFLLEAGQEEREGEIKIIFVNNWGVPLKSFDLKDIQVKENLQHTKETDKVLNSKDIIKNINASNKRIDLGNSPSIYSFFGRLEELLTLERWLIADRCRFVTIAGMAGIGKTSLCIKLAHEIRDEFDYVIWRSLINAPPANEILSDLINFFSDQSEDISPIGAIDIQISQLLHYLQNNRCLLFFDNIDSILQSGKYSEGCEEYDNILRAIGETDHQSCLVTTCREVPQTIVSLQRKIKSVRSFNLNGLSVVEGKQIFEHLNLQGTEEEWENLIDLYNGNPLALELASMHIQEIFSGNISSFLLDYGKSISFNLSDLLDWNFDRLSNGEKGVMYWLAICREPVSLIELMENIVPILLQKHLMEFINSLKKKSLIEHRDSKFSLQPIVLEYSTSQLIEQTIREIRSGEIDLLNSHSLSIAKTKDYVRDSQTRMILTPVIGRLIEDFESVKKVQEHFNIILSMLREKYRKRSGYACGNILSFLLRLKTDLTGYDFSGMNIWQSYLQGINLNNVDFTGSDFSKCVWSGTLNNILSVSFSIDSKTIAIGSSDNNIHLFNAINSVTILVIKAHTNRINSVAFSQDGQTLASGSSDRTIKIWDISTGQCLKTLMEHTDRINSVAFSHDSQTLASGSSDRTIKIWDISTGQCLKTLMEHTDRINSVASSHDSQTLASGSSDRTIKIWDISTGQCLKTLMGHTDRINSVAFSHDSQTLVSGGEDKALTLWDSSLGKRIRSIQGSMNRICSIAFNHDYRTLASGGDDQTVRLWSTSTGECLMTMQGHEGRINSIAFSPNGLTIASGGDDQTVRLWSTSTGECLMTMEGHQGHINSIAFSPDGHTLASSGNDQTVRLWDISKGGLMTMHSLQGHINSITFSPDGHTLASGGNDQTVRLWSTSTGKCLMTMQGHEGHINSITFSPDGHTLASGGNDQRIKLWRISTGECLMIIQGHEGHINSIAFSPDGHTLASGGNDQRIKLWSTSTGECLMIMQGHQGAVGAIVVSMDNYILGSSSHDETIKLWDLTTGNLIRTIRNPRLYEGMKIKGATGLTQGQISNLVALGAILN